MAFWSSETMKQRLPQDLIHPYDPARVKEGAYQLAMGSEAFITSHASNSKQKLELRDTVIIPPGQFGLLLTEEIITIPNDAMGFISIRAKTKFKGLVNVSGFHVDPGFSGFLKFSVYNAGSQEIRLSRGEPYFLIWLSSLDSPTSDLYNGGGLSTTGSVLKTRLAFRETSHLLDLLRNNWMS